MFTRIIRHLLPSGRAWRLFPGKQLTALVEGLASVGPAFKAHIDKIFLDVFPKDTRFLRDWERQFGLRPGNLTDAERRDRLRGEWTATGGQSLRYIQDTLRSAGFDVTVYEWWIGEAELFSVLDTGPDEILALDDGAVLSLRATSVEYPARDPRAVLGKISSVRLGNFRLGNVRLGERDHEGYVLVNRNLETPEYPDPPTTEEGKRYVAYIGGAPFGTPAEIPANRRQDFEALLLKICPTYQWLGIIVKYT